MFDNKDSNLIVITSENYKLELLKSRKKLLNIKFMSMEEFIKSYYFDYDEKAILYLIKKYNIKYDLALEYLNNLILVEDLKESNKKYDFLINIKNELIENNLLIFNKRFKNYISDKNIIVYNYILSKFEKYLLKDIHYKIVEDLNNNYIPKVYEFNTIEDEVNFVAFSISKLINSGVEINKIKLSGVNKDYINTINKIFSFYNLKIDKFNNIPIISTIIGKKFYENLSTLDSALNSIEEYSSTNIYKKIIDICNKYIWVEDLNDLKILIKYSLYHTYIENKKYTNMVEVIDFKNYKNDYEYLFLLGFNEGLIPNTYKDEDYINDSIKLDYMDSTNDKNIKEKQDVINSIKNIKNLTITYKLKDNFNTYYPSSLIDELNVEVTRPYLNHEVSYSELYDKINLASYFDDLIKFGKFSDNLDLLFSNYDIPYNNYSHGFTGLDKSKLNNYIKSQKNFNLSYTSMDNYNRCSFRFFIDKILCLDSFEDSIGVILGNIYHDVLEKALTKDIDIKEEVESYIKSNNINLTRSNKFFVKRAIKNLDYVISVIKKQNSYSNLNKIETEKFIKVPIKDNINFVGFIDKIAYNTFDDTTIASIIDYKTYVKKPSLKYIESGIGLQLPSYMYLSNYNYKNIKFAGVYLQNITLDNKSEEEKEKSLKLIGFTNSDKDILKEFDREYMASSVIEGIKVNKDGSFSSNSLKHMLSTSKMNEIIDITKDKINETVNNILNSKFDINPKYDKENIGCEFCKYKDICYKKEYDFVKINSSDKYFE